MRYFFLLFLIWINHTPCLAQLNVELLHQLVEHSKDEYDKQQVTRNSQAITTSLQEVNTAEASNLKKQYKAINERLNIIGTALVAINSSLEAGDIVNNIARQQSRIMDLVIKDPSSLTIAMLAEKEILIKARQLIKYILALMISYQDINQMAQSDRRMLYAHINKELRELLSASYSLANSIATKTQLTRIKNSNPFWGYINTDKRIVESILTQLKGLKK